MRLRFPLALLTSALAYNTAFGAAFQLYELGTPIIGSAGVGQAVVNDASSAYFNPAAMTQLKSSAFMLGSQIAVPFNKFSIASNNTIAGNNGGDAATIIPGLDLYYVYSYSPSLKFGVNLTSPYGGQLDYNDGWVGRYIVQFEQFYTLDLNPALAYQFNQWVSAGAGFTVEYINLHEMTALPTGTSSDGQINVKLANTSMGYNLGLLFTPTDATQIGITYRSKISHHLTGNSTFLRVSDAPTTTSNMIMPQSVILSASQKLGNSANLLGELGWANWSSMQNTILNISGYSAVTPRNWNNTYRFGLAGHYQATDTVMLQLGASVDTSPTDTAHRLPDLPMDRQIRIGAGLAYNVINPVQIAFSYEYVDLGRAAIDNTSSNGTLAGNYSSNFMNVIQASINVKC